MDSSHFEHARAKVAWLAGGAVGLDAARSAFRGAGYDLHVFDAERRFDLAVVDLRTGTLSAKNAAELAVAARRGAPDCGVVYATSPRMSDADRAHLRRSGELVLCDDDLSSAIAACRARLRIRNIAEETGERLKTVASLTRLSEFPPIETSSAPPAILIAGAPGRAAACAFAAAQTIASDVTAVFSAGQAMRALETGAFDCAVFLPKSEGDPLVALSRSMRRHRQHQDLPILLVAPETLPRRRLAAAAAADILPPALIEADLPGRATAFVRRARLLGAMRTFLNACAGEGVRDRASGVFTPQFFAAHAERVFARADQTHRPAALVGLRLAPPAPDSEDVSSVRTLTDAARLIGRVTRAEDCVARISANTFAVLMSATTTADAFSAARRIEGVIANTMFRLRGEKRLFAVAAATAAVAHAPGQRFEETLAQVLAQLQGVAPRTAER